MERNMELVRDILLMIEKEHNGVPIRISEIDAYEPTAIRYHAEQLSQAGFLCEYEACPSVKFNEMTGEWIENELLFEVNGLTWEGHEFLDIIRDATIWTKTKSVIIKQGLPMVVDVIKSVATSIIKETTTAAIKGFIGGA